MIAKRGETKRQDAERIGPVAALAVAGVGKRKQIDLREQPAEDRYQQQKFGQHAKGHDPADPFCAQPDDDGDAQRQDRFRARGGDRQTGAVKRMLIDRPAGRNIGIGQDAEYKQDTQAI